MTMSFKIKPSTAKSKTMAQKTINTIRVTFILFITLASFCGTSLNKRFSISLLLSRQTNDGLDVGQESKRYIFVPKTGVVRANSLIFIL